MQLSKTSRNSQECSTDCARQSKHRYDKPFLLSPSTFNFELSTSSDFRRHMATVKLIECPRDAWQGLPDLIPTEYKAEYLKELIAAGFKHIDAASFVSPKHVKQMADSEEVMAKLNVSLYEAASSETSPSGARRQDAVAT